MDEEGLLLALFEVVARFGNRPIGFHDFAECGMNVSHVKRLREAGLLHRANVDRAVSEWVYTITNEGWEALDHGRDE